MFFLQYPSVPCDSMRRIPHYISTKQIIFYHLPGKKSRYLYDSEVNARWRNGENSRSRKKKERQPVPSEETGCLSGSWSGTPIYEKSLYDLTWKQANEGNSDLLLTFKRFFKRWLFLREIFMKALWIHCLFRMSNCIRMIIIEEECFCRYVLVCSEDRLSFVPATMFSRICDLSFLWRCHGSGHKYCQYKAAGFPFLHPDVRSGLGSPPEKVTAYSILPVR